MADKYLRNNAGTITETEATVTSAGAGNAGDIIALDGTGKIDDTLLPPGIGADTQLVEASENLAAGDLVNVWSDAGDFKARKADASTAGKEAHAFVLDAVVSGADAVLYFEGTNNQVSGLTPGRRFLSASVPGGSTSTAPSGAGQIVQRVGVAVAADTLNAEFGQPIVLA